MSYVRARRVTTTVKQQRGTCRYCMGPVQKPRLTFCSDVCVHEWKVRSNPGYARKCVWERDKGKCELCPTVCAPSRRRLKATTSLTTTDTGWLGWEMDHRIPVAEGGGDCGLSNLRTLCVPCHRRVTAELKKRLAERRRVMGALYDGRDPDA